MRAREATSSARPSVLAIAAATSSVKSASLASVSAGSWSLDRAGNDRPPQIRFDDDRGCRRSACVYRRRLRIRRRVGRVGKVVHVSGTARLEDQRQEVVSADGDSITRLPRDCHRAPRRNVRRHPSGSYCHKVAYSTGRSLPTSSVTAAKTSVGDTP